MAEGERFRRLEAEGIASSTLPEEVRTALDGLTEVEVDALIAAKQKVQAAASEVEGFAYEGYLKASPTPTVPGDTIRPGGSPQTLNPDQFAHEGGFVF